MERTWYFMTGGGEIPLNCSPAASFSKKKKICFMGEKVHVTIASKFKKVVTKCWFNPIFRLISTISHFAVVPFTVFTTTLGMFQKAGKM